MAYQSIPISNIDLGGPIFGLGVSFESAESVLAANYNIIQQTQENIKSLLLTLPGERTGQWLSFGCDLKYLVFEPNLNQLKPLIADSISDAFSAWLTDLDLTDIQITTSEDDPDLEHSVIIRISYVITNAYTDTLQIAVTDNGNIITTE